MFRNARLACLVMAAAVAAAGCTMKKSTPPPLSGPSEFSLSLTLLANPDTLSQDGASQSQIFVLARDANSQVVRNLPMRAEIVINGVRADFGQLNASSIVTGSDGRASLVYTAPPPPADGVDHNVVVSIMVTPTGTNYANAVSRGVDIRLVPPGIILPPNGTPVPKFTVSPSNPVALGTVTFDASTSSDDGSIVSYNWTFGDGDTGTGVVVQHRYPTQGIFSAMLTVTDDRGLSASTTQDVRVGTANKPFASFVVSPDRPLTGQTVFFNASGSTAGEGHRIVRYQWDFGNGKTGSGLTATTTYSTAGSFTAMLTVTDDAGQTASASRSVGVSAR